MEPETQTTTELHPIEPCPHMRVLVSSLSDGTLKGPARWYTRFHVVTCPKCKAALKALQALHGRLEVLGKEPAKGAAPHLSLNRQEAVKTACDEIDKAQAVKDSQA